MSVMREVPEAEIVPWIAEVMTQEGVSPTLEVLFVPDYSSNLLTRSYEDTVRAQLQYIFPNWVIRMEKLRGPFEDDEGNTSFLDGNKYKG